MSAVLREELCELLAHFLLGYALAGSFKEKLLESHRSDEIARIEASVRSAEKYTRLIEAHIAAVYAERLVIIGFYVVGHTAVVAFLIGNYLRKAVRNVPYIGARIACGDVNSLNSVLELVVVSSAERSSEKGKSRV